MQLRDILYNINPLPTGIEPVMGFNEGIFGVSLISMDVYELAYIAACGFLIIATVSVVAASGIDVLKPFLYYGKVQQEWQQSGGNETRKDPVKFVTEKFTVPKSWFIHFYVVYVGVCCVVGWVEPEARTLFWGLSMIQSMRRLMECFFLERPNPKALIQVTHYAVGLMFYLCQGVAMWEQPQTRSYEAVALFTFCSIGQCRTHVHLCSLKKYTLPRFKVVSCPHYLAEIGIYASFVLLIPQSAVLWLSLVWVIINLSASAKQTQIYYRTKFRDQMQQQPQYAIIPFVF